MKFYKTFGVKKIIIHNINSSFFWESHSIFCHVFGGNRWGDFRTIYNRLFWKGYAGTQNWKTIFWAWDKKSKTVKKWIGKYSQNYIVSDSEILLVGWENHNGIVLKDIFENVFPQQTTSPAFVFDGSKRRTPSTWGIR